MSQQRLAVEIIKNFSCRVSFNKLAMIYLYWTYEIQFSINIRYWNRKLRSRMRWELLYIIFTVCASEIKLLKKLNCYKFERLIHSPKRIWFIRMFYLSIFTFSLIIYVVTLFTYCTPSVCLFTSSFNLRIFLNYLFTFRIYLRTLYI